MQKIKIKSLAGDEKIIELQGDDAKRAQDIGVIVLHLDDGTLITFRFDGVVRVCPVFEQVVAAHMGEGWHTGDDGRMSCNRVDGVLRLTPMFQA